MYNIKASVYFVTIQCNCHLWIKFNGFFQAGVYWKTDGYGGSWVEEAEKTADEKELIELWKQAKYVELRQEFNGGYEVKSTRQVQIRQLLGFSANKFAKLREIIEKHKHSKILIFNEFVDGAVAISHYLQKYGHHLR